VNSTKLAKLCGLLALPLKRIQYRCKKTVQIMRDIITPTELLGTSYMHFCAVYIHIYILISVRCFGGSGRLRASRGYHANALCFRSSFNYVHSKQLCSRFRLDYEDKISLEVWHVDCAPARVSAFLLDDSLLEVQCIGCALARVSETFARKECAPARDSDTFVFSTVLSLESWPLPLKLTFSLAF